MTQKHFTKEFVCLACSKKELTGYEQDVLICLFAEGLDRGKTISSLRISKSTLEGRMKSIYRKFEITGSSKGKLPSLRKALYEIHEEYRKSSTPYSQSESSRDNFVVPDVTSNTQITSQDVRINALEKELNSLKQDVSEILKAVNNSEDNCIQQEHNSQQPVTISDPIEFMSELSIQLSNGEDSCASVIKRFCCALPVLMEMWSLNSHYSESEIVGELIDAFRDILINTARGSVIDLYSPKKDVDKV